jgi:hypothetical protein
MERSNVWESFRKAVILQAIGLILLLFGTILSFTYHTGLLSYLISGSTILYVIVTVFGSIISVLTVVASFWMIKSLSEEIYSEFGKNLRVASFLLSFVIIFFLTFWGLIFVMGLEITELWNYIIIAESFQAVFLLLNSIYAIKSWKTFPNNSQRLEYKSIRLIRIGFFIQFSIYILVTFSLIFAFIVNLIPSSDITIYPYMQIMRPVFYFTMYIWLLFGFLSLVKSLKSN